MSLSQLSQRDRLALIIGGSFILLTLLVLGVILPYRSSLASLDTAIRSGERQVQEVRQLRQEFLQLQQQLNVAEQKLNKPQNFSLFSFVEGMVTQVATRENLVYMRPQQSTSAQEGVREEAAEIRLEKIRLEQLVRFLHGVETTEAYLNVKSLRIRTRFDDRALLDVVMTISSYGRST